MMGAGRATVGTICDLLRSNSFPPTAAFDILNFVLYKETPSASDYEALHGLKVIPLVGGKFGTAHSAADTGGAAASTKAVAGKCKGKGGGPKSKPSKKGTKEEQYVYYTFVHPQEVHTAMPDCPYFVHAPEDLYPKLASEKCHRVLNIESLKSGTVLSMMPYCLPAAWEGKSSVCVLDGGIPLCGTAADMAASMCSPLSGDTAVKQSKKQQRDAAKLAKQNSKSSKSSHLQHAKDVYAAFVPQYCRLKSHVLSGGGSFRSHVCSFFNICYIPQHIANVVETDEGYLTK